MKQKRMRIFLIVLAAILALFVVRTFMTPGHVPEDYVTPYYSSILSLLPPVVAIALALITKEVYSSLFLGILTGAMLYSNGNLELAVNTMMYDENGGMLPNLTDISHASILVFVVLLATVTTLMNKSGGSKAFGDWASTHIKTRVGAQLATMALGILIFVDDGFNCMTVGSVMRPLTDHYRVSRSKLSYIIDATAAPICIIAPISSWAAAVSYSLPSDIEVNGFTVFLRTIPYNFYALGTLMFLYTIITGGKDYGPMKKHEENTLKTGDLWNDPSRRADEKETDGQLGSGRVSDLVIPVASLIICCIIGMLYTGGFFEGEGFVDAFANSDAARGFVMGSLISIIITFFLYMWRGTVSFAEFMKSIPEGWGTMVGPMVILVMAWTLSGMTGLLGAREFIHDVMAASAGHVKILLPMIIFLVALFLAFSTGTSWGTFSILIPIVCGVFVPGEEMFIIGIAACLAGSVCGDHCSPISDTTIMSSAGAKSNHINHVSTQMPYALTTAAVCAVGYLIAGVFGYYLDSPLALISLPIMLAILVGVIVVIRKRVAD